jgi:hypothetical protein
VLKFLSNKSIVIPPARTGKANNNRIAVIKTAQQKRGILCKLITDTLIFSIVTIKLIAPNIEEIPANRKAKIAKSTAGPDRANLLERGAYNVQPVPAPDSTIVELKININEGTNSQKLMLFNLGKAMSGAARYKGTIQFPKPPIVNGIKK